MKPKKTIKRTVTIVTQIIPCADSDIPIVISTYWDEETARKAFTAILDQPFVPRTVESDLLEDR